LEGSILEKGLRGGAKTLTRFVGEKRQDGTGKDAEKRKGLFWKNALKKFRPIAENLRNTKREGPRKLRRAEDIKKGRGKVGAERGEFFHRGPTPHTRGRKSWKANIKGRTTKEKISSTDMGSTRGEGTY